MDNQQVAERGVIAARSTLVERLAALERRVTGTADDAISNVKDTAATVRSVVTNTAHDVQGVWGQVSSGVRDSLDISKQIRTHPWETIGLAAGLGFLAGFLPRHARGMIRDGQMNLIGDLLNVLRKELIGVGEATIAAGAAAIKQNLYTPHESNSVASGSPYSNGRV